MDELIQLCSLFWLYTHQQTVIEEQVKYDKMFD